MRICFYSTKTAAKTAIVTLMTLLLVGGCGWPRVHKVTVQQGNVISQEMIDKLSPGMTRSQVEFIMGSPVVKNSFNSDRWDYIYTILVPSVISDQKRLSIYFENDLLAYFTGDFAPTSAWKVDYDTEEVAEVSEVQTEAEAQTETDAPTE